MGLGDEGCCREEGTQLERLECDMSNDPRRIYMPKRKRIGGLPFMPYYLILVPRAIMSPGSD